MGTIWKYSFTHNHFDTKHLCLWPWTNYTEHFWDQSLPFFFHGAVTRKQIKNDDKLWTSKLATFQIRWHINENNSKILFLSRLLWYQTLLPLALNQLSLNTSEIKVFNFSSMALLYANQLKRMTNFELQNLQFFK